MSFKMTQYYPLALQALADDFRLPDLPTAGYSTIDGQKVFEEVGRDESGEYVYFDPIGRERYEAMGRILRNLALGLGIDFNFGRSMWNIHDEWFRDSSQSVISFRRSLVELLMYTEYSDVPCQYLRAPYDHFYVHFEGHQDLLSLGGDLSIEGAYVELSEQEGEYPGSRLDINFVTHLPITRDPRCTLVEYFNGQPHLWSAAFWENGDISIGEALSEFTYTKGSVPQEEMYHQLQPKLSEALRVVINGLFYMTSYRGDEQESYTSSAPARIVSSFESTTRPSVRARSESKLASRGYRRLKFFGDSIEDQRCGGGRDATSHWRRGHWRNQACGEGYSMRRLTWIRPTLVRADKGGVEIKHLYDVDL